MSIRHYYENFIDSHCSASVREFRVRARAKPGLALNNNNVYDFGFLDLVFGFTISLAPYFVSLGFIATRNDMIIHTHDTYVNDAWAGKWKCGDNVKRAPQLAYNIHIFGKKQ